MDEGMIRGAMNVHSFPWRLVLGIFAIFSGIMTAVFTVSYLGYPKILPPNEVGDSFGVVNALFSSLAFALLIYTAMLQSRELSLQREELRLAKEETARVADAQEKSERALDEQSKILRKTLTYNAFQSFTTEYAQPEMSQSVRVLWDFGRGVKGGIEKEYIKQFNQDYPKGMSAKDKMTADAYTIHNRRRLVSQFYHRVQSFIDQDIFPKEIFYVYWTRADLEIIPQVLVPMEIAVGKIIKGEDYQLDMSDSSIMKLYDNSPKGLV